MTPLLVLENGGVFQKTGAFVVWGWSRRTGGQALWGGGRQQAAMKTWGQNGHDVHEFFTPESFF